MKTAVVIEDSARVREITAAILTDLGFEVFAASGVDEGLKTIGEVSPDTVFLDWDLPKFGALDVLKEMIDVTEARPQILLMAAENDPKQFALARAAGATSYILKPFDRYDFMRALEQAGIKTARGAA